MVSMLSMLSRSHPWRITPGGAGARMLDPLLQAGRDPDFQAAQIHDFRARLDSAMAVVPTGQGYARPVSAYLTSEKGAALVLDESFNRPFRVAGTSAGRSPVDQLSAGRSLFIASSKAVGLRQKQIR
jgi:hypothetical protein